MKTQIKKSSEKISSIFFSSDNSVTKKTSFPAGSIRILGFLVSILLLFAVSVKAQDTASVLKVKTSAVCKMCKKTIETALASEKGIKKSELDVKSKIVTVNYNSKETTPEKIRKAIAEAGYDADDVSADPKAYKKLEKCCQKGKEVHK